MLSALCGSAEADRVEEAIFVNSTTLGVRRSTVQRRTAKRSWVSVETPWGEVRVKVGLLGEREINAAPEFEDCARLAEQAGVPVKVVYAQALSQYLSGN